MSNNVIEFTSFAKKPATVETPDLADWMAMLSDEVVDDVIEFLQQEFDIDIADFPEATASVVLIYEAVYGLACLLNNQEYPTQEIARDLFQDFIDKAREEDENNS